MTTPLSECYQTLKTRQPDLAPEAVLKAISEEMGVNNLSYVGFPKFAGSGSGPVIHSTYDPAWVTRYTEARYDLIDPVIDASLDGTLPVDWSDLTKTDKQTRNFFGEASEFGVRPNGISIPIHDHLHGRAVLTLNTDLPLHEWRKYRRSIVADALYLGCLMHSDLLAASGEDQSLPRLSPREKEVLKWAAVGKTAWETAQILTVSASTVNHHLYNACAKLGVSNKTHAVAKAVQARLIRV